MFPEPERGKTCNDRRNHRRNTKLKIFIMEELNDKLESLPFSVNGFWRNQHYAISKSVTEYQDETKVVFSIFLGHHLPISSFHVTYVGGEQTKKELVTMKPISPEEIKLKMLMI